MSWGIFPMILLGVVVLLGAGSFIWLCWYVKKLDRRLEQQVRDTFEKRYRPVFDEIWAELRELRSKHRRSHKR